MTKLTCLLSPALVIGLAAPLAAEGIGYGPRPGYLIDRMDEGPLKDKLAGCMGQTPARSDFSIGHRGHRCCFLNIRWSPTAPRRAWGRASWNAT